MAKQDSFFDRVYKVVVEIPAGRVTTYGAIGNYLGSKGSARMVGWAMNASHTASLDIPAHRVLNRKGVLTGKKHFGTMTLMQQLLESEGLVVENDQVVNFEKYFWDPMVELVE